MVNNVTLANMYLPEIMQFSVEYGGTISSYEDLTFIFYPGHTL